MSVSRRDFLLAGSAFSTLWLTGCGGGGSADGAPKPITTGGTTTPSSSCLAPQAVSGLTSSGVSTIAFTSFTNTGTLQAPFFTYPVTVSGTTTTVIPPLQPTSGLASIYACSNPQVPGVQGSVQEMFFSAMEEVFANSNTEAHVRTLRLHVAIPPDPGASAFEAGYKFNVGDPVSPNGCPVFSGSLIVNNPLGDDGSNSWAFDIVSGQLQILTFDGIASMTVKLINVVATAAQAGSGNNQAVGSVTMNGELRAPFDLIGNVIAPVA